MKKIFLHLFFLFSASLLRGQIDARLFRYPDVSQTQICFVYGGDIWVVPRTGGTAIRLTSSRGEESYPRFSPDGKTLAFSASYSGNVDAYLMSVTGGVPARLTYNGFPDRVVEWLPNGDKLLIASARESGSQRFNQFYTISRNGGLPDKLNIPYGELGSFSPDGNRLAYVTRITENFPFKRYRGGYASDVLVFDLKNGTAENITQNPATDGKPAWVKDHIYYVSDAGKNKRRNIWVYDLAKKSREQLTDFSDIDVNYMSAGPDALVFEAGGKLYLFDLKSQKYQAVNIEVVADIASVMPRAVNVGQQVQNFDISPDGKRAVLEARGELFSLPAEYGVVLNLTNTSGAFDQNPAWSPDGKFIAYWSDQTGEYEIWLREANAQVPAKKLTSFGKGMGWHLFWSPDSRKIAFINFLQEIQVLTVASGEIITIDKTSKQTYESLTGFGISWSKDSKWLAYSKGTANLNDAIFLYSLEKKKLFPLTTGYYNDIRPVFDPGGKYLFFQTDRRFNPTYSSLDATWIYSNTTQLAYATLDPSTKSLLYERNDEVSAGDSATPKKDEKKKDSSAKGNSPGNAISVVPENFESRLEILPVPSGNYGPIGAVDGKLVYVRSDRVGEESAKPSIFVFDLEKREEKELMSRAGAFSISADGKSILVRSENQFGITSVNPGQKIEKPLRVAEMEMTLDPREEWKQIFNDTWRRYRDFFYDPGMHQVDWNGIRKQYGQMVNYAITRWDLNNILSGMIAELSAGHTYAGGGDVEQPLSRMTGFLGIDWEIKNQAARVKRIVRGGPWDNEVRSPLDKPGLQVKEGDYILAVNGQEIDIQKDPSAALEGLSGKTVSLLVNSKPAREGAREILVKTLSIGQEARLRNLEWIEGNRKKVEELSGNQLGYMYMPNTGQEGQSELLRQFYAQIDKQGFIIDERFNAGGQLADRFIEMLNRKVLYNIAWRNADVTVWPQRGNDGPKVMLINGWAGSGGDAFPWAFQEMEMGPIIGERTLGILVGPATGHELIDGGFITVPDARLYGSNGKWFAEGIGVKPDIPVWDDPALLAKGKDPQLERAIEEAMKLVKAHPRKLYPRPAFENRSAAGIPDNF